MTPRRPTGQPDGPVVAIISAGVLLALLVGFFFPASAMPWYPFR